MTGWTWQTPPWAGTVVWSVTDRGAVAAYSVGNYDDKTPFKPIAEILAEAEDKGPTFALAKNDHELWRSSSRSNCFDLSAERANLNTLWTIQEPGPAMAPVQAADRIAVLTHQAGDKRGLALWGVDSQDGRVRWRTVLGTPWPLAPTPATDRQALITLGIEGKVAVIEPDMLKKGGFIDLPIPASGTFRLPAGDLQRYQIGKLSVIVPSSDAQRLLTLPEGESEYKTLDLPAPLTQRPWFGARSFLSPARTVECT